MEKLEVDEEDRPRQPVSITGANVFVNPYKDEEAAEKKAAEEARIKVPTSCCCARRCVRAAEMPADRVSSCYCKASPL